MYFFHFIRLELIDFPRSIYFEMEIFYLSQATIKSKAKLNCTYDQSCYLRRLFFYDVSKFFLSFVLSSFNIYIRYLEDNDTTHARKLGLNRFSFFISQRSNFDWFNIPASSWFPVPSTQKWSRRYTSCITTFISCTWMVAARACSFVRKKNFDDPDQPARNVAFVSRLIRGFFIAEIFAKFSSQWRAIRSRIESACRVSCWNWTERWNASVTLVCPPVSCIIMKLQRIR